MKWNTYKIKKVKLDSSWNVAEVGKRCATYSSSQQLTIGGLYFLEQGQLYRVEQLIKIREV